MELVGAALLVLPMALLAGGLLWLRRPLGQPLPQAAADRPPS